MKEFFESRRLTGAISLTLSNKKKWSADKSKICNEIISTVARYQRQGYRLTLRQLYYQLVSSDTIPNDDVVYKKMSGILDDLRYAGKIDWDAIEDRGRVPYLPYYATGIPDAMNDIIRQYRLDRMEDQDVKLEVWTEKDAISGILRRVTSEYHVQLVVNKGYSSSSAMHMAYGRFAEILNDGQKIRILYFGDHDPSGLDMIRDIRERLSFFFAAGDQVEWDDLKGKDGYDMQRWWDENGYNIFDLELPEKTVSDLLHSDMPKEESDTAFDIAKRIKFLDDNELFQVIPIGLTWEQIQQYNPPPNPAKISDPRAAWYIEQHGQVSYEVDALRPDIMAQIVRDHIISYIDMEAFERVKETEKIHTAKMVEFAKQFEQ